MSYIRKKQNINDNKKTKEIIIADKKMCFLMFVAGYYRSHYMQFFFPQPVGEARFREWKIIQIFSLSPSCLYRSTKHVNKISFVNNTYVTRSPFKSEDRDETCFLIRKSNREDRAKTGSYLNSSYT